MCVYIHILADVPLGVYIYIPAHIHRGVYIYIYILAYVPPPPPPKVRLKINEEKTDSRFFPKVRNQEEPIQEHIETKHEHSLIVYLILHQYIMTPDFNP